MWRAGRFGIFTPTEAAAVFSFFVATVIDREPKWAPIYQVLVSAALTTAVAVVLVVAARVSAGH